MPALARSWRAWISKLKSGNSFLAGMEHDYNSIFTEIYSLETDLTDFRNPQRDLTGFENL